MPDSQGNGLGTALAYTGLLNFPPHLKSALCTLMDNEPMHAWAKKYGYHATELHEFKSIPGKFVRYEADSVREVLRNIEAKNKWLVSKSHK